MSRARLTVAKNVYAYRLRRGMTQAQLAEKAGVSRRTVQTLESLDGDPYLETIIRVCNALGLVIRLRKSGLPAGRAE